MTAKLLVLRETNLHDIPGTLRCLADRIEAGEYGQAQALVWVLDAENIDVGFAGLGAHPGAEAHLLLHAGAARLVGNALAGKDNNEGG